MAALKLVSINIERSKHLDRVVSFLEREQPDVVCFQELREGDLLLFEEKLGMHSAFLSNSQHREQGAQETYVIGTGILTALPLQNVSLNYYRGSEQEARHNAPYEYITHTATGVLSAEVLKDNERFIIATTHFTWTPDGLPDEFQRTDIEKLFDILRQLEEVLLCGDFNAPRGGEIWQMLADKYTDNIPLQYKTSLDVTLHRAGKERPHELENKMVDGLFTTPGYVARDVRLEFGISDHAAIVATIEKVS